MRVTAIGVDPLRGLPLVTLSDEAGGVTIEIEVGLPDAQAIASELRGVVMERPATHDLLKAIVEACGGRVVAVELREVRAGAIASSIILQVIGSPPVEVEARPSDALALALRAGATVRVARKVIEWSRRREARRRREAATFGDWGDPGALGEVDAAAEADLFPATFLLEALPDEEFGKWKM